jgi:hypothetical protein
MTTEDIEQLTITYLARQTSAIRLWFVDTVLEAALGWDDCQSAGTPLDDYPAPVRVQAVARTLRSWVDDAANYGIDPLEYIHSKSSVDLADQLRHCDRELLPHLQASSAEHRRSRTALASYYAHLAEDA